MLDCGDKIWIENFRELFCNFNVIPCNGMSLKHQLNAITRLVILIFIILFLLFDFRYALLFFVLSLLFIIILYYIQRNTMNENYEPPLNFRTEFGPGVLYENENVLIPSQNSVSKNQLLAGPEPEKVRKTIPKIAAPSHDIDQWRATNNTQRSCINKSSQFDNYRSGYIPTSQINEKYTTAPMHNAAPMHTTEEYIIRPSINTSQEPKECYDPYSQCGGPYPYIKTGSLCGVEGHINTACGCNMQNNDMPVNQPSGLCQQDSLLTEYNKKLNTMYLQPESYVNNEVKEPINSLMGISFNQQFNPRTVKHTDTGETFYTKHATNIEKEVPHTESYGIDNIYDPRYTSYGDNTRCYFNEKLGRSEYYYDDVNAFKYPNYVVRSNIDHIPEADSTGPLENFNRNGNIYTPEMRDIVQKQFLNSQLSYRNDLMESLVAKGNAKREQQRQYPIRPF